MSEPDIDSEEEVLRPKRVTRQQLEEFVQKHRHPDESPYFSLEEVAKHFKVSDSTVRKWVRSEHIPKDSYFLIGHTYRFDIDKVTKHLFNNDEQA
tara:strand:+ start:954 stop:1238 length:285 start_codon:yes stop_codon:yes gene_type:complete